MESTQRGSPSRDMTEKEGSRKEAPAVTGRAKRKAPATGGGNSPCHAEQREEKSDTVVSAALAAPNEKKTKYGVYVRTACAKLCKSIFALLVGGEAQQAELRFDDSGMRVDKQGPDGTTLVSAHLTRKMFEGVNGAWHVREKCKLGQSLSEFLKLFHAAGSDLLELRYVESEDGRQAVRYTRKDPLNPHTIEETELRLIVDPEEEEKERKRKERELRRQELKEKKAEDSEEEEVDPTPPDDLPYTGCLSLSAAALAGIIREFKSTKATKLEIEGTPERLVLRARSALGTKVKTIEAGKHSTQGSNSKKKGCKDKGPVKKSAAAWSFDDLDQAKRSDEEDQEEERDEEDDAEEDSSEEVEREPAPKKRKEEKENETMLEYKATGSFRQELLIAKLFTFVTKPKVAKDCTVEFHEELPTRITYRLPTELGKICYFMSHLLDPTTLKPGEGKGTEG